MTSVIIIPARWGSTRFPGKPLADLRGRTLLQRVVAIARRVADRRSGVQVAVATDDERIAQHARSLKVNVVVSDEAFDCGTARALAATQQCTPEASAIVNLQGDAPFVSPTIVMQVLDAVEKGTAVATPVVRLDWAELDALRAHKISSPFSGTTCIRREDGQALWFSKTVLPGIRDEAALRAVSDVSPVLRHIGLYGYARTALEQFVALPVSVHERLEGLEQLRLIEAGIPIGTLIVESPAISMSGIDTPADLYRAGRLIDDHGEPPWL